MTRDIRFGFVLALVAVGSFDVVQEPAHVIVRPENVTWGPAPPKLPAGAQFARISGDASMPGEPYVFRARLPDGYRVPPHWHPMDEHVTVIQGVFKFGFGSTFDGAAIRELPAGSYVMLPKNAPHYNVMKGETVLQFHGVGPYDLTYVNAADDPRRPPIGSK
jgi:ChrR-like protein with cupin domain